MATIETDTANPERLVKRFITRFRQPDAYQRLAAHAALPLVLTPELLHYLRNAFLRGEVPWVAEADLLLSDLCEEVGYEQYVMVPAVRDRLIADLKQTYGEGRLKEAARLIWQYLLRVERTAPALGRDALQAQQWSAMAYLDSERVARENAEKIKAALVRSQDRDALASLAKITETLAPQLQSFPALVEYARQLSLLLSGETETTTGPEPPTTGQIGGPNVVVGGVELPPIKDVAEALSPKLSDVSEAIEKTLDLKIVPEERVRGDLPIGWTNLPPHNRFFTGREEILKQLRVALEEQRSAALVGMPGVGKTQTAIEYAHRYLTDYAAVLWVRSDTETSLASGYRAGRGAGPAREGRERQQ